jgi:hypothetical protein
MIEPLFRTGSDSSSVALGRHEAVLHHPGGTLTADAEFTLTLMPFPRLEAHFRAEPTPLLPYLLGQQDHDYEVEVPSLHTRFPVHPPALSGVAPGFVVRPSREPIELHYVAQPSLNSLVFHVLNFYDFFGGGGDFHDIQGDPPRSFSSKLVGCVRLEAEDWRVTLHALPETKDLVKHLDADGGYAITHVGRIERSSGAEFAPCDAMALLERLRLFLSFARGTFIAPILPVGMYEGDWQWSQWGCPMAYPWDYYHGWFHGRQATMLEHFFPGFCSLQGHPLWHKPVRDALYWYLRSNNTKGTGVDGGIILTQAALERLAWTYVVDDRKLYTEENFERMSAGKQIVAMLDSMSIPTDVPSELACLHRLSAQNGWQHGPWAFTAIRNELVHARARYASQKMPFFEAWNLGQHYLALAIMRIAGHSGRFVNRITARWVTQTEPVPWDI